MEQAGTRGPSVVAQPEDPDSQGWLAQSEDLGPLQGSLPGGFGVAQARIWDPWGWCILGTRGPCGRPLPLPLR